MNLRTTFSATLLLALGTATAGCSHDAKITKPAAAPTSVSTAPSSMQNASIALPPSVTDVTLPTSSNRSGEVSPLGLRVYVGRKDVAMGNPPRVVAALPDDVAARAAHGFDATLKRSGENDLFVKPIADAIPKDQHDALLYIDRETPYRVLIEVLFTLSQSEVAHFHFVTTSARSLDTIDVDPPQAAGSLAKQGAPARLGLTLLVVKSGISIKARGGNVAPGCNDTGPGLAIPLSGDHYDFAALGACLAKLKAVSPELAAEREVTISAGPSTSVQDVIATMDAARGSPNGGILFPTVVFGISR